MKVLLSLFVCFHLLAIFVLPNPNSILYRELPVLVEYGKILGINTTFQFFSPNPFIKTVEYEYFEYDDSDNIIDSKYLLFPESVEALGGRDKYNRTLYFAVVGSAHPDWAKSVVGSFLCRLHPKADVIAMHHIKRDFYPIEKARLMSADEPIFERRKQNLGDVYCERDVTSEFE